jgi:hypothetical protein
MEGKTLIVKTFGLSQTIYSLQAYGFIQAYEYDTDEKLIKIMKFVVYPL